MAKKTVRPTTPATPSTTPSRRRAPRASSVTAPQEPVDSAADMRIPGDIDSAPGRTPTAEEIAEAAYRRYLERGGQHGQDFDDWLEAERSLRNRR
jgi:hypothetical protein